MHEAAHDTGRQSGVGEPRQHLDDLLLAFEILARNRENAELDPVLAWVAIGLRRPSRQRAERCEQGANQDGVRERRRRSRKLFSIPVNPRQ